jgi:hypothetical protein
MRLQPVRFRDPKPARYFRLVSSYEVNLNPWTSAADINIYTNGAATGVFASDAQQIHAIRGSDGTGWLKAWSSGSGGWSHWDGLGGGLASDPSIVGGPGRWDLFVRGTDQGLWTGSLTNGTWSGWSGLGGQITERPSAVQVGSEIDVLVRGTNGDAWFINRVNGSWSVWSSLGSPPGGSMQGEPTLVGQYGLDTVMLLALVRGADGAIWQKYGVGAVAGGSWGPWVSLGGNLVSQPTAIVMADGSLSVFAIDPYHYVWTCKLSSSIWGTATPWTSLGNALQGFVTPLLEPNGDVSLFALGTNGGIYTQRLPVGGQPSGWSPFGIWDGGFTTPPRVVVDPESQVQLTAVHGVSISQNRRLNGAWGFWLSAQ